MPLRGCEFQTAPGNEFTTRFSGVTPQAEHSSPPLQGESRSNRMRSGASRATRGDAVVAAHGGVSSAIRRLENRPTRVALSPGSRGRGF